MVATLMTTRHAELLRNDTLIRAAEARCLGQTFGWLRKKTRRFPISRYEERFFTISFDAQVLYYTHDEFGTPPSIPIRFCDILGVEPLSAQYQEIEHVGEPRTSSWKSYLPIIWKDAQEPGFILHTTTRRIQFACTSQHQATTWITTIQAAMCHNSKGMINARTKESESEQSTRSSSFASFDDFPTGLFEVDDEADEPRPFRDVSMSSIALPGKCFTLPRSNPDVSAQGPRKWNCFEQREEGGGKDKSNIKYVRVCEAGTYEYANIPLAVRLLASGKSIPPAIEIP